MSFVLLTCNQDELNIKSTLDMVTRICLDLDCFTNAQIVDLIESCLTSIRQQDSKTVYWKDLLPQLISVIFNKQTLNVGDIEMSGVEYRSAIVKNITMFNWRQSILTPIAAMFK